MNSVYISLKIMIQVKVFGAESQLTKLVPDFTDVNPDDAFSSIPYEKGHMLLYHLEQILGGVDVFNKYLKAHIERFKGLPIDTDMWKSFLYEYFSDKVCFYKNYSFKIGYLMI